MGAALDRDKVSIYREVGGGDENTWPLCKEGMKVKNISVWKKFKKISFIFIHFKAEFHLCIFHIVRLVQLG